MFITKKHLPRRTMLRGLGATLALINGWAGLSLLHAAWEMRYLGWRFTAVRWTLMLFFLALIGLLTQAMFEGAP